MDIETLSSNLQREAVIRARNIPPEERLRDGMRLFAGVCQRMKDGIRGRFPEMSSKEIHEELRRQLAKLDRIEEKLRASRG